MAFKLQLTDEMIRFFREENITDTDAGKLIRLLIDIADEQPIPKNIPQPFTYTLPIFQGQIESFRAKYLQRIAANAQRQRRFREAKAQRDTPSQPTKPNTTATIAWSNSDYNKAAESANLNKKETERFLELNESGKLSPDEAIQRWLANRTPTEINGGAKAIHQRKQKAHTEQHALKRAIDKFKDSFCSSESPDDFIKENFPVWFERCPDVPPTLQSQFQQEIKTIVNNYRNTEHETDQL